MSQNEPIHYKKCLNTQKIDNLRDYESSNKDLNSYKTLFFSKKQMKQAYNCIQLKNMKQEKQEMQPFEKNFYSQPLSTVINLNLNMDIKMEEEQIPLLRIKTRYMNEKKEIGLQNLCLQQSQKCEINDEINFNKQRSEYNSIQQINQQHQLQQKNKKSPTLEQHDNKQYFSIKQEKQEQQNIKQNYQNNVQENENLYVKQENNNLVSQNGCLSQFQLSQQSSYQQYKNQIINSPGFDFLQFKSVQKFFNESQIQNFEYYQNILFHVNQDTFNNKSLEMPVYRAKREVQINKLKQKKEQKQQSYSASQHGNENKIFMSKMLKFLCEQNLRLINIPQQLFEEIKRIVYKIKTTGGYTQEDYAENYRKNLKRKRNFNIYKTQEYDSEEFEDDQMVKEKQKIIKRFDAYNHSHYDLLFLKLTKETVAQLHKQKTKKLRDFSLHLKIFGIDLSDQEKINFDGEQVNYANFMKNSIYQIIKINAKDYFQNNMEEANLYHRKAFRGIEKTLQGNFICNFQKK